MQFQQHFEVIIVLFARIFYKVLDTINIITLD